MELVQTEDELLLVESILKYDKRQRNVCPSIS